MGKRFSFLDIQEIMTVKTDSDYVEEGQVADFETAIHYAGHGKFQRILLFVSGLIYATCAISATTLSFVLPSAQCDFDLTSADKGQLSAMPLAGMVVGGFLWGWIADYKGRRPAILLSLSVDFLAGAVSSGAQNFVLFSVCRFFNGFGIIGATTLIFPYLGEFASKEHRDVMMGRLEIFWNVGVIALPGFAWLLLNKTMMDTFEDNGNFSPWRIFVLVCSVPSLITLILLYFLPETPKFLISKQRFQEAKMVFQGIFSTNTGQSKHAYPVMTLQGENEDNNNLKEFKIDEQLGDQLNSKLEKCFDEIKVLFTQPYLKYLGLTCFVDFALMASYYTLIMWFPEIFERFNEFSLLYPNRTASVCTVSDALKNVTSPEVFFYQDCDPTIDNTVFFDTIIIGLSCIPVSVSLSFFMKKFGKKLVLICALVLAGLSTLSLNWVQSSVETLILSCVFEALTSILETVIICISVDLFPTNLRAVAVALTCTSGRVGAIIGNLVFGLLIDLICVVPMYILGSLLIVSGILCIALPHSDAYHVMH